jgi:hypothetical protein
MRPGDSSGRDVLGPNGRTSEQIKGMAKDRMTPAQKLELKRLTPTMWATLRNVANSDDPVAHHVVTAKILARRGFLVVHDKRGDGWRPVELTDAGREAIA